MRVTHNTIASSVLANLQGNISRLGETQQRLSSGKQINRPSDSPGGTVSAMEMRSQIATNKQYVRNADDGEGWLNAADTALQNASDQVIRARGLVLQGMSTGSNGPQARQALADEIRHIRESIRGIANTSYLDRPVFAGSTKEPEAYPAAYPAPVVFNGDGADVMRTVGANTKVPVNVDGGIVFGDAADSIFHVLDDIATALETDPSALSGELARLDAKATSIRTGLSTVGARTNQLERMRRTADDTILNITKSLSDVEDVDLPQTITELQLQQTAYQAALAAGARVVQPSLVDFLR
jgi:flagellar hook-associated protein 3 FlgL